MPEQTSQRFHQILSELGDLHRLKTSEYGTEEDPFATIRENADERLPLWMWVIERMGTDIYEAVRDAEGASTRRASVVSSLNDIASWAIIARILYEEEFPVGGVVHTWEGRTAQPAQTSRMMEADSL